MKEAFFGCNMTALEYKVNELAGDKVFDSLRDCLDRAISDDYTERVAATREAQEILARHPELNSDSVHLILQDEVGQVFAQVLADAGVYKLDEAGRAGFVRFLESVK